METFSTSNNKNYRKSVFENIADSTKEKNPFTSFKNKFSHVEISKINKKIRDSVIIINQKEFKSINIEFDAILKEIYNNKNKEIPNINNLKKCELKKLFLIMCETDIKQIEFSFLTNLILSQHCIAEISFIIMLIENLYSYYKTKNKKPYSLLKYAQTWMIIMFSSQMEQDPKLYLKLKAFINNFNSEIDEAHLQSNLINDENNNSINKIISDTSNNTISTAINNNENKIEKFNRNQEINSQLSISNFEEIIDKFYSYSDKINSSKIKILEKEIDPILPVIKTEFFDILNWNEKEIARQITLTTQFLYCKIEPIELIETSTSVQFKFKNSPNLVNFLLRFNKISLWVQEEILSYDKKSIRSLVIGKFLDVIKELRNMYNYNDMVNIITALYGLPIRLLKKTFMKLDSNKKALLTEYSYILSSINDFFVLRKLISTVPYNTAYVPYLGIFLKDLSEVHKKNEFINDKNEINLEKLKLIGEIADSFVKAKNQIYIYKPVFKLGFLSMPTVKTEDELLEIAEKLEPKFVLSQVKNFVKRPTICDLENNSMNSFFKELLEFRNQNKKEKNLQELLESF